MCASFIPEIGYSSCLSVNQEVTISYRNSGIASTQDKSFAPQNSDSGIRKSCAALLRKGSLRSPPSRRNPKPSRTQTWPRIGSRLRSAYFPVAYHVFAHADPAVDHKGAAVHLLRYRLRFRSRQHNAIFKERNAGCPGFIMQRQTNDSQPQPLPNRFWVTDITYIPTPSGMLYMCAVIDLCGKMVMAYRIGDDMTSFLVTHTIRDAIERKKVTGGLALYSGQGAQHTSTAYFDLNQSYPSFTPFPPRIISLTVFRAFVSKAIIRAKEFRIILNRWR